LRDAAGIGRAAFSLTSAAEYGLKASQTDNWPGKRAKCPFPAGFLIQLSAFFRPSVAFPQKAVRHLFDGHIK
jgi:hypothetical protein